MVEKDEIEINKSLNLLAKGSFIVFIGVFLSKTLTYLYKFIIARSFGPESYGVFSLALIIVTIFSTLASLGLVDGLLRYISLYNNPKNIKKIKPLLKFSLIFCSISGVLFSLALFASAKLIAVNLFHDESLTKYLIYFSISIPFVLISNLFLSIIKANQQIFKYTFNLNILQNLIRVFGIFTMIFIGFKSQAIIGSYLLGVFSLAIGSYIGAKKYILDVFSQEDVTYLERKTLRKAFISYSLPIVFAGFVGTMLYWIDSLVIGYLIDTTSVGIYSVAFTIVSLLGIAPELFMQLFLPIILKEYSNGKIKVIDQTSKQVSKWIGILNIPAFTLMFLFPELIITFLFGNQYLEATLPLKILAVGGFFSSFTGLNTNLLSMKGKSKSILVTLFIASIINLFLDFVLIKKYGINGAAIATSTVWFLTLVAFAIQVYNSTKIIPVRRKLFRVVILSFIPATVLIIFSKYVSANLFGITLGLIVYFTTYLLIIIFSNSLDHNDYNLIKKIYSTFKFKNK